MTTSEHDAAAAASQSSGYCSAWEPLLKVPRAYDAVPDARIRPLLSTAQALHAVVPMSNASTTSTEGVGNAVCAARRAT